MSMVPGKQIHSDDVDEEEMGHRRRLLLERFMESFGPARRGASVAQKVCSHPCAVYSIKLSVKKARLFWSHRNSHRFIRDRRGPTGPIVLCRAVELDQVEMVMHRSAGPGEPDRPGVLTVFHHPGYYTQEFYRERGMIQKEGSAAPWMEVAVIRGMPGGCGITVTSHVNDLVLRQLHDLLFRLPSPAWTVDIRFSERWFCLPTGWVEEGLFAEDGLHLVDIAAPLESLATKLYDMRKQEEQEMERRRSETEEEKARRLQEEEVMRKREEERRKVCQRKNEERIKEEAAAASKMPANPPGWDAVLGKTGGVQPALVPMFNLSMNNNKQVLCKCIKEECPQDMLRKLDDGDYEFILPISKTTQLSASTSPGSLEVLGYVECYFAAGTCGFLPLRRRFMDESGRMLSSVLMFPQSLNKVLTIVFLVDKFNILMDDGLVISGRSNMAVDIHCDDISCSELLITDWRHQFFCQNIDGEVMIPFSTLLVQLKKKLQLQLTVEELDLYTLSIIHIEEENDELALYHKQQLMLVPTKPKHELAEVALHDYSQLFPTPWQCEV